MVNYHLVIIKYPFFPVSPVFVSEAMEWNTRKINKDVANYKVFGLSFGEHQVKNIQKDCFFWKSKKKTGERGVKVTFKDKVVIKSFEFQTRQDSVKFKMKLS